ncbi:PEP-CTERM sorting domain-containing protein [Pseudoduganella armeniaca]|uniref:PEP-CTERM sorting domain-containing protein n=1 Tax=Pseudoduganella armeniaca TaxID=2072590 RepID=A0A2R4CBY4_9BURK|nr:PEP-CTERM sorting domain-containing protein [Pseudoduganella armeniaca]AVR97126.1 hypothetical protein C9I28_16855 [Pseudoduganella armeniaca]
MKKLIAMLSLALCSSAQAAPVSLWVTYTGFQDSLSGSFDAGATHVLHFTADDRDGDGSYSLSEVLGFSFGAIAVGPELCDRDTNYRMFSCLSSFLYRPGGTAQFTALRYEDPRVSDGFFATVVSGAYYAVSGDINRYPWHFEHRWTPATQVTISPVPEPAAFGMLAGGLAVVAGALRRRMGSAKA